MAQINDLYIHVVDEKISRDIEVSSHSVEEGIEITDTIKRQPVTVSISGNIVNYQHGETEVKAYEVIGKLTELKNKGKLITYNGRNIMNNMQIVSFNTSHPNTIWGGAEFDMELRERRFAKNAYVAPKIDESSVKNGGQQQVEKGENEEVWYTVKSGDCCWTLVVEKKVDGKWVDADYKNLKREGAKSGGQGACDWVMEKNPKAFSKYGDFGTLQTGAKILLGTR